MSWQIVPVALMHMMQDPDTAKSQRAMQAMLQMKKSSTSPNWNEPLPARANTLRRWPAEDPEMKHTVAKDADKAPRFWRDDALPFIEARSIADGREVCYSRHSHAHFFSIGAITAGRSTYIHEQSEFQVSAGTVVLMNPGDVHACNPIDDQPWSYLMLYVETPWLTDLQHQLGFSQDLAFRRFSITHNRDVELFAGLKNLYEILVDQQQDVLCKHSAAVEFFSPRCNSGSTPSINRCANPISSWNGPPTISATTAHRCSSSRTFAKRRNCRRPT